MQISGIEPWIRREQVPLIRHDGIIRIVRLRVTVTVYNDSEYVLMFALEE